MRWPTSWRSPGPTPRRPPAARPPPGPTSRATLDAIADDPDLWGPSRRFDERLTGRLEGWVDSIAEDVQATGGGKRRLAQGASIGVNAAGVGVMLATFAHTGGVTGAEVGVAAGDRDPQPEAAGGAVRRGGARRDDRSAREPGWAWRSPRRSTRSWGGTGGSCRTAPGCATWPRVCALRPTTWGRSSPPCPSRRARSAAMGRQRRNGQRRNRQRRNRHSPSSSPRTRDDDDLDPRRASAAAGRRAARRERHRALPRRARCRDRGGIGARPGHRTGRGRPGRGPRATRPRVRRVRARPRRWDRCRQVDACSTPSPAGS